MSLRSGNNYLLLVRGKKRAMSFLYSRIVLLLEWEVQTAWPPKKDSPSLFTYYISRDYFTKRRDEGLITWFIYTIARAFDKMHLILSNSTGKLRRSRRSPLSGGKQFSNSLKIRVYLENDTLRLSSLGTSDRTFQRYTLIPRVYSHGGLFERRTDES